MRVPGTALLVLCLAFPSCHGSKKQDVKAEKKKDPVDLGDPSEPLEIRALKGAKQVSKDQEKKREEEKQILQQRDQ